MSASNPQDLFAEAVDLWADCAKRYLDLWTANDKVYATLVQMLGSWSSLFTGGLVDVSGRGASGPIPNSGRVDPKQTPAVTKVTVHPQPQATGLRASAFLDGNRHYIPEHLVTLLPAAVPAHKAQPVVVQVLPPIGVPAGTYGGTIIDDDGKVLVDHVEVEVTPITR